MTMENPHFLIGNTSSNDGCFSIVMLVFGVYLYLGKWSNWAMKKGPLFVSGIEGIILSYRDSRKPLLYMDPY